MFGIIRRPRLLNNSGTAAVEFALVAPAFLLLIFGVVVFSVLFSTYNAVEQLAAEAARAGLGGLNSTEQSQMAQAYVTNSVVNYPFLDASQTSVKTTTSPTSFAVTVSYNVSGGVVAPLVAIFGTAAPVIVRSASVQTGGF